MEYEAQQAGLAQAGLAIDPRIYANAAPVSRTDFASLRNRLETCAKRAAELGTGAHALADQIVGSRPEQSGGLSAGPSPVVPTLADLVVELEISLTRIETGLNRL